MKMIDISAPISTEMMVYKDRDEKRPHIKPMKTYQNSDFYESRIDMDLHTGTHVDTPLHMVENGITLEKMPLELWQGKAKVIDLSHLEDKISREDLLYADIEIGDIVLLKTRNSFESTFNASFIYLDKEGAAYLASCGVKGIGIDALGIERAQAGHETHKILFDKGIFILEGIILNQVEEGSYYLMALPLNIIGVEASPVRAVLLPLGTVLK